MDIPSENSEIVQGKPAGEPENLRDTADKFFYLGVAGAVLSNIVHEINKLKAKVLPVEKPSFWSWGSNNAFTKKQPLILAVLSGFSLAASLFLSCRANQRLPVAKAVNKEKPEASMVDIDHPHAPAVSHVERYQNDQSQITNGSLPTLG